MKAISNADYSAVLRLLEAQSKSKGTTLRERENARKATLIYRKLKKNEDRIYKVVPLD